MAHFAQLDKENKVIQVLVTNNDDPNGDEGLKWLEDTFGGTWIQTSYSGTIRGKYAGIGDFYDENEDIFIQPQLPKSEEVIEEVIDEVIDEAKTI